MQFGSLYSENNQLVKQLVEMMQRRNVKAQEPRTRTQTPGRTTGKIHVHFMITVVFKTVTLSSRLLTDAVDVKGGRQSSGASLTHQRCMTATLDK